MSISREDLKRLAKDRVEAYAALNSAYKETGQWRSASKRANESRDALDAAIQELVAEPDDVVDPQLELIRNEAWNAAIEAVSKYLKDVPPISQRDVDCCDCGNFDRTEFDEFRAGQILSLKRGV